MCNNTLVIFVALYLVLRMLVGKKIFWLFRIVVARRPQRGGNPNIAVTYLFKNYDFLIYFFGLPRLCPIPSLTETGLQSSQRRSVIDTFSLRFDSQVNNRGITSTFVSLLSILFLISCLPLWGVTIGSDTAPSRLNTVQTLNTGDRVATFPFLYGGLALSSLSVTATWDCAFPLGGPLTMNGGTLLLNTDLYLGDNSAIISIGGFIGNNHVLSLSPTNTYISLSSSAGAPCTISNLNIELASDVYLQNCHITFTGNSIINGNGSVLTLLPTATLIVGSNALLELKDITINGMSNNTLYASSTTSTFILNNTTINLSNNYTFSNGSLEIYNDVLITGSSFGIYYSSPLSCTIESFSQLMLDLGVTFSYVPSNSSNTGFAFVDSTSQFYLRGGIFYVGSQGLYLLKGTMLVDKTSYFVAATTGTITTLGDGGNPANDFTLNIFPAATLNIVQGYLTFYNV